MSPPPNPNGSCVFRSWLKDMAHHICNLPGALHPVSHPPRMPLAFPCRAESCAVGGRMHDICRCAIQRYALADSSFSVKQHGFLQSATRPDSGPAGTQRSVALQSFRVFTVTTHQTDHAGGSFLGPWCRSFHTQLGVCVARAFSCRRPFNILQRLTSSFRRCGPDVMVDGDHLGCQASSGKTK
ncbi:hypothetical protein A9K55_005387 [Cordyceps militaris]|uniref:Uncharacterized protein n=1 Tax=Cordyceps militaris TaxID=73501 RepID=A0A2H4SAU1_CORMI|nr:hypothetical protein A9K55_005387 [Cordyceps militaris]